MVAGHADQPAVIGDLLHMEGQELCSLCVLVPGEGSPGEDFLAQGFEFVFHGLLAGVLEEVQDDEAYGSEEDDRPEVLCDLGEDCECELDVVLHVVHGRRGLRTGQSLFSV